MDTLGRKIRDARRAQGLTQAALASLLGVKNTAVSNWERNLNKPDIDTLEQMCDVLQVVPGYFFAKQPTPAEDAEMAEVLEYYKSKPGMRLLFSITKDAKPQDIIRAAELIEGFKKANGGE